MESAGGDGATASDRDPESESAVDVRSTPPAGVRAATREVRDVSVRAFLGTFDRPHTYWSTPDGLAVAGAGAVARLTATGESRFDRLRARADRLFETVAFDGPPVARPRVVGGLSFHPDHRAEPPWESLPAAGFVLPRLSLVRSDDRTLLTAAVAGDADADPGRVLDRAVDRIDGAPTTPSAGTAPGVRARRPVTSRREWTDGVERLLDRIDAGDLQKAVLATALRVDLDDEVVPRDVLDRLRRTHSDCFHFLVDDGHAFFGAPPERLVAQSGHEVRTEALAGTVPRGDTPAEDDALAARLLDDEKITHEQRLVTEAIRERLAPIGTVRTGEREVRRLAGVQHLETPVEATLTDDRHVLDLVERLHPTPAVGGRPVEPAVRAVRAIESFERGWYAAPVGWFDAAGDGEFAVAIRSGVAADRRVTLFAGSGVVADSDPDDEWDEVNLKWPILDELRR